MTQETVKTAKKHHTFHYYFYNPHDAPHIRPLFTSQTTVENIFQLPHIYPSLYTPTKNRRSTAHTYTAFQRRAIRALYGRYKRGCCAGLYIAKQRHERESRIKSRRKGEIERERERENRTAARCEERVGGKERSSGARAPPLVFLTGR